MKQNVGSIDKMIRVIAGLAILTAGLYYQTWWGAVGVLPLLTAAMGWCPPYALFGISTCPMRSKDNS